MIKQGMLISLLTLLATTTYAEDTISVSEPVFVGKYQCEGTDPYLDKAYKGTVVVTQHENVYALEMDYNTGESALGTGGQYDPTLMSVVFQDKKNAKHIGLEQYNLTPDKKSMQGYWVYLGQNKLGKEVCTKVS